MYVCGPTVYSNASWKRSYPCHLTLFLGIFAFDYKVRYVEILVLWMIDEGEDKLQKKRVCS
jgi:hypothetical protein